MERLTPAVVRNIDRFGGTYLHTSRTNPQKVRAADLPAFLADAFPVAEGEITDCTPHVLRVLESLGIDALVPIGGDDTLSYGVRLHGEGFRVVAIPKTMDNDVSGTEYCLGFSTAVSRSVEFIHQLRSAIASHQRVGVVELFGRNSGATALVAGFLADADRVLIPEVPFDIGRVAELIEQDRNAKPRRYAVITVSEGAIMEGGDVVESGEADAFGHRKLGGIGEIVGAEVKRRTGINIVNQKIAYLMRSGPPDSLDRMVSVNYGNLAVQQLEAGASGVMVALRRGAYEPVPVSEALAPARKVDVAAFYDAAAYRPRVKDPLGKPMFWY